MIEFEDEETSHTGCPFCAILRGEGPGKVLVRDEVRQFALIENLHPEGSVHWLVVPFEHVGSTQELEQLNRNRFLAMVEFGLAQAKSRQPDYPLLQNGYTVKFHCGSFETVPHAKLHIMSVE
jgi:histidine triad (HIT) family protein